MAANPSGKKCAGRRAKQPGRKPWYYRGNVLDNIRALEMTEEEAEDDDDTDDDKLF